MPSLSDAIANSKLPNYAPAPSAPTVISVQPLISPGNANQRFILPPFNADPDSVRQFEGTSPKIRVWPRPQQKAIGNSTTIASSTSASSSSSSSSATVTLSPKTAVFTTGVLPAGTNYRTTIQMAESFQLLNMSANSQCEVRIYGTQIAQIFDSVRPTGNPVPPEISQNILSCITFASFPYTWPWQNRMGANQDIPQTPAIYVTVFNTNSTLSAPVTVTINYLPLES